MPIKVTTSLLIFSVNAFKTTTMVGLTGMILFVHKVLTKQLLVVQDSHQRQNTNLANQPQQREGHFLSSSKAFVCGESIPLADHGMLPERTT